MENKVLFSIVIPTYNRAELLKRCLESVLSQTYSNWEAIVVDNYSEDETEFVVNSFADRRIKYIKNHNYGIIAVSRNKALDMANGDWICFLDSDDCWLPNKLERILPYTERYDLIYHGYRKNVPRTKLLQVKDEFFYEIKEPTVSYVLQRGDPINPSCASVSKRVLADTRFDEGKDLIAVEDYDFFLQLLAKNIKVKYLHVVLTLYDVGGCSHDEAASERDYLLFKKWASFLSEEEKTEVEYQYLIRKADCKVAVGKYDEAKSLFLQAMKSQITKKRIRAAKGYIKCVLKLKQIF